MTQEEYCRHLDGQLCWNCHCPTHVSNARQRQCPRCRKKWSFRQRRSEWRLAELFCHGLNAHQASRELGISYGTARSHFKKFQTTLSELNQKAAVYLLEIRDEKNRVPDKWQKSGLQLLFTHRIVLGLSRRAEIGRDCDFLIIS